MTTITLPRATVEQALEALKDDQYRLVEVSPNQYEYKTGLLVEVGPNQYEYKTDLAIAALERALAQQAEPVPMHRINSWGFCGVCRHDRIPGEGCARQECPDSPQQAEPVEPVAWVGDPSTQDYASTVPDPQIADRLARHGIPMPGDPK